MYANLRIISKYFIKYFFKNGIFIEKTTVQSAIAIQSLVFLIQRYKHFFKSAMDFAKIHPVRVPKFIIFALDNNQKILKRNYSS